MNNKFKWTGGIIIVFLLIISTNLIDKDQFLRIENSVNTIYEDRLVAKDIIFETSLIINKKELALVSTDTLFFNTKNKYLNTSLDSNISVFQNTKLTEEEEAVFTSLNSAIKELKQNEKKYLKRNNYSKDLEEYQNYESSIEKVKIVLYKLSKIQMDEGKKQQLLASKSVSLIALFTRIEIIILIILAIIVQVIIIYSPKKVK